MSHEERCGHVAWWVHLGDRRWCLRCIVRGRELRGRRMFGSSAMPYGTVALGWWSVCHVIRHRHRARPHWYWWYDWEGSGVWLCERCQW